MVDPLANTPIGAVESVQARNEPDSGMLPDDNNDPAWFLPQGSSSLQAISAIEDPSLQAANPDSVASLILSHISA